MLLNVVHFQAHKNTRTQFPNPTQNFGNIVHDLLPR